MDKYKKIKVNKNEIDKEMKEYMSDSDISHYLGKNFKKDIIKYSEMEKYNTIDEMLPKNNTYKIILLEETYNSGHWVAILRYNNTIEYFNSYGLKPSVELDGNSYLKNKQLNQDVKYLNILLNKELGKKNIIFNKIKFQKYDPNIATCGRWCVLRCLMFKKYKMDLPQFIKFIDDLKNHFNLSSDQLVTLLVNSH